MPEEKTYNETSVNDMAMIIAQHFGWEVVSEDLDFSTSENPRAKLFYSLAEKTYDFWSDILDVDIRY